MCCCIDPPERPLPIVHRGAPNSSVKCSFTIIIVSTEITSAHVVPNVQGKLEAEAVAALRPLKIHVRVTDRPLLDNTTAGAVISQRPRPGTKIHEGGTLELTVSRGPPPVAVPDLTGAFRADATTRLGAAQLAVGNVATTYDEQAAAGLVLAWTHKGEQVPKHTPIDLTVSAGPRPRTVPSLAGKSFDQAAAALQAVGLVAARGPDAFSDTVPKDQVISSSPAAGASVDRGSKVTVTVSKGPDMVPVPDVSGKSVQDATTVLQQAGLQVSNVFGPPQKKVFVTDPPAGTQAHRGSSVNLYTK